MEWFCNGKTLENDLEYNLNEQAIIFFTAFDLSYKKQKEIFGLVHNSSELLVNFNNYKSKIEMIINDEKVFDKIIVNLTNGFLHSYIKNLNDKGIVCVTAYSKDYPDSLREIDQPPYILFCMGDISLLKSEGIAVVGTRTPTQYGKIITADFVKGLVLNDFTIISGMAAGVDTIAHKTALENGGKTIAVLGGGFEHIYPAFNAELFKKIAASGLVISEYTPSTKPALFTFPFRNRIIAGLSRGVVITEAGEKSGALHTKEYALETGKEVFAVPGNVNSQMSKGTNRIIRNLQGACVLTFEDIVCKFKSNVVTSKKPELNQTSIEDNLILSALKIEGKTVEELQEITKLPTNKLNSCLTIFEIKGIVRKLPGNKIELV